MMRTLNPRLHVLHQLRRLSVWCSPRFWCARKAKPSTIRPDRRYPPAWRYLAEETIRAGRRPALRRRKWPDVCNTDRPRSQRRGPYRENQRRGGQDKMIIGVIRTSCTSSAMSGTLKPAPKQRRAAPPFRPARCPVRRRSARWKSSTKSNRSNTSIYGGAVGYMSYQGDMDVCIAIHLP